MVYSKLLNEMLTNYCLNPFSISNRWFVPFYMFIYCGLFRLKKKKLLNNLFNDYVKSIMSHIV